MFPRARNDGTVKGLIYDKMTCRFHPSFVTNGTVSHIIIAHRCDY